MRTRLCHCDARDHENCTPREMSNSTTNERRTPSDRIQIPDRLHPLSSRPRMAARNCASALFGSRKTPSQPSRGQTRDRHQARPTARNVSRRSLNPAEQMTPPGDSFRAPCPQRPARSRGPAATLLASAPHRQSTADWGIHQGLATLNARPTQTSSPPPHEIIQSVGGTTARAARRAPARPPHFGGVASTPPRLAEAEPEGRPANSIRRADKEVVQRRRRSGSPTRLHRHLRVVLPS